jgi:hypothetical protein
MSGAELALGGAPELLVEPAERRAAIAGDEARGVEPGAAVALALHQQHADERLRAGDEDALLFEVVLVVERIAARWRIAAPGNGSPSRRVATRAMHKAAP